MADTDDRNGDQRAYGHSSHYRQRKFYVLTVNLNRTVLVPGDDVKRRYVDVTLVFGVYSRISIELKEPVLGEWAPRWTGPHNEVLKSQTTWRG